MADPTIDLNLVDYLAVIGFDREAGLEVDLTAESFSDFSTERSKAPLDRSYKASVLQVFPKNRPNFPFVPEVSSLCMPKGLQFYTERKLPPKRFHSFVLIREDGQRVNGCAYTFYEPVVDLEVRQQILDLHLDYIKEITESSEAPHRRSRSSSQPGQVSFGERTLPRNVSRRNQSKRTSYYDSIQKPIYVAKCLCVVQRLPVLFSVENLLLAVWQSIFGDGNRVDPIDLISWILYEIPLPIPGTALECSYVDCDLTVRRPGLCELPFFDYPIYDLFRTIPVDKLVKLFTCFMLEHQILLCSKRLDRLMLVAECLSTLIFPFRWQLTYVPILPFAQLKFIEAPVPYLMGFCYDDRIPDQIFQSNVCVLDIDASRLDYPEDVPTFPKSRELITQIEMLIRDFDADATTGDPFKKEEVIVQTQETTSPVRVVMRSNGHARRANRRGIIGGADSQLPVENQWSFKRMSRSFDNSEAIETAIRQEQETQDDEEVPIESGISSTAKSEKIQRYLNCLSFNAAIRELFLHTFVGLFTTYEQFVINSADQQKLSQGGSRDSVVNFDRASFLSDQPDSSLPFLAAFLETQMFASFVDAKLFSQWRDADENIVLFDMRVAEAKTRTATANRVSVVVKNEFNVHEIPKTRPSFVYDVPPPRLSSSTVVPSSGIFPQFDPALFESTPRVPLHAGMERLAVELDEQREKLRIAASPQKQRTPRRRQPNGTPSSATSTPGQLAQQRNWTFVEQLLKETKIKTKRLLLMKMGKEALQLGHHDSGVQGVEENTLVAGFCDLLDRVWAHGLKKKQGKSSLWANVLSYYEQNKFEEVRSIHLKNHPNVSPVVESDRENVENCDEEKTAIGEIFGHLRALKSTIEKDAAEDPTNTWSVSLLRVANFISDKIAVPEESVEGRSTRPPIHGSAFGLRSNSVAPRRDPTLFNGRPPSAPRSQLPPRPIHKSSSANDFGPQLMSQQKPPLTAGSQPPTPTHQPASRNRHRKRSLSRPKSPIDFERQLPPLPTHIGYDLRNVLRMTEIKTDIGFARAFVRLSLERKLLHSHLKSILGDRHLLRELFKRYAFLRSEDEREQFLYHCLSLNAVDFSCFTHTFLSTRIQYEVLFVGTLDRFQSAAVWLICSGSLGATNAIHLPPNSLQFTFDHKNLGILTTLRIGFNAREKSAKWFLDYVIVRNNITAQTFRFNCGRSFGRGVDDGATERVLVAETIRANPEDAESPTNSHAPSMMSKLMSTSMMLNQQMSRPESPASSVSEAGDRHRRSTSRSRAVEPQYNFYSARGSSLPRPVNRNDQRINELQHKIGESVNALVKHFYQPTYQTEANLTQLLCGDKGLVIHLEQVFLFGRKDSLFSNRFFGSTYPWDYIEKAVSWFASWISVNNSKRIDKATQSVIIYERHLLSKIAENNSVGKEGKFRVFLLLALRDRHLSGVLPLLPWAPVTRELYDETSILRQPQQLTALATLLKSLDEFNLTLEKSLTYGIVTT
ncbi:hypothetical protein M3Y95_00808400 [Aphelenchoides besseyi]|nr:hypothetical protein M3Y95_00808400 [Aphelenchoides besseyi]